MNFDFAPYFKKYEALVSKADHAFERVKQAHAECVKCKEIGDFLFFLLLAAPTATTDPRTPRGRSACSLAIARQLLNPETQ